MTSNDPKDSVQTAETPAKPMRHDSRLRRLVRQVWWRAHWLLPNILPPHYGDEAAYRDKRERESNPRNIYMSTLDQADIDVMKATKTCVAAQRFQYDYLNDDITDDGQIDYNLSNKVPAPLRAAIAAGKKILVLINPPYAESGDTLVSEAKSDVAATRFAKNMADYGYATRELFTQFVARISLEMPSATLAMFSKLKYVNAPNFEKFRATWRANYLGGFVVAKRLKGSRATSQLDFWFGTHQKK